ncbi:restriction endonuclease subunit S [Vulcaniibacterium gelatinicum]|uniref:restriction endonuclease subunit S n=1 Tax=Vulcaniibacterium gelatinicum TaxID=2598725 RepID=UPI0011C7E609|nr:restriction endonuclease subunit S [Vulcaniibacterium gelatinicum]
MSAAWLTRSLGEVVAITKGRKPPRLISDSSSDSFPYATAEYFRSGIATQFVPSTDLASCVLTRSGCPVLIWDGSNAGEVFVGKDAVLASTMALIRPDDSVLDEGFCYFFLKTAFDKLNDGTTGSTIPHVSKHMLTALQIPILPLPEQRLISSLLFKLESAIALQAQLSDATAEIKRAAMRELFTRGLRGEPQKETEIGPVPESWQIKAIGHVFEIVQGLSLKGNLSGGSDGVPFLRTSNVYWGRIDLKNVSRMHVAPELIGDRWLRQGDLLVCEGGEIGRAAVWESKEPGYTYQNHLHRLRPLIGGSIEPKFAAAWLEVGFCHRKVYEGAGNKTTIPNLSRARLAELPMPVPAIDEQRDIVAILDAIDRKIELHRKKRTVLEELFKALLHKLMTGEIRVDELDLSALQAPAEPLSPAAEPAV